MNRYMYIFGREIAQRHPNSNVIAALIRLLRRKIELKNETPLITTVYGKGYRLGKAG